MTTARGTIGLAMVAGATLLAGCGSGRKAQARADEQAAGFVPPSVLSRLDYGGTVERRFRTFDRNGDDQITADELPRVDSRLMALDHNHDGKISAAEWSEGMLARFDRADANRDGSVTSTERESFRKR